VFLINLPVGVVIAAAVPAAVAAARPAHAARQIDLPGALTATLATAAVVYGLVTAGSDGWAATTTAVPLAAGLVLAGVFVAIQRTAQVPLVPLGLVVRRPLLAGQLVMLSAAGLLLATLLHPDGASRPLASKRGAGAASHPLPAPVWRELV
jgi:hypothetical protein